MGMEALMSVYTGSSTGTMEYLHGGHTKDALQNWGAWTAGMED
jgi:hypothetical protein